MELVVVTGLSGAGRRSVLGILEDLGCTSLDNVPAKILESLLELESNLNPNKKILAVGMDNRHAEFAIELEPLVHRLKSKGISVYILFIESDDNTLMRRFSESRRPHSLSHNGSLVEAIDKERDLLKSVRNISSAIINTSSLSLSQLRQHISALLPNLPIHGTTLRLISFGFKYNKPSESDMILDARFLPNPYYKYELQKLTGKDCKVQNFLIDFDVFKVFLSMIEEWILWSWPYIQKDGRMYHNIAIGCTGGQHRSVALVEILAQRLECKIPKLMIYHQQLYK